MAIAELIADVKHGDVVGVLQDVGCGAAEEDAQGCVAVQQEWGVAVPAAVRVQVFDGRVYPSQADGLSLAGQLPEQHTVSGQDGT